MTVIVFTDLDGTLLDHAGYGYAPARPALDALRAAGIALVLCSSKTAAEMAPLHAALGLHPAPFVVENGAGIVWADAPLQTGGAYGRIRAALADLGAPFRGFGDMDAGAVARATGLPLAAAERAKARDFSEPGQWLGDPRYLDAFLAALAERGITAKRGGRFLTLSKGGDKAQAMRTVAAKLGAARTVALGDAPNDADMIAAADFGVIVANPQGTPIPPLPGEASGRIIRTTAPGPAGWNAAMLSYLETTGAAP